MPTEEPNAPTPKTALPQPKTSDSAPQQPLSSPWEGYLTGKKVPAERFLGQMSQGPITIPDAHAIELFAEAIAAKPTRLTRFISLLQASDAAATRVRDILAQLTATTLRRLHASAMPDNPDVPAFEKATDSWLYTIPKRPLKPAQLNSLFLFLHFGSQSQLLDPEFAIEMLSSATTKPAKKPRKQKATHETPVPEGTKKPIEILLTAPPSRPVLVALLDHSKAWVAATEKLNRQIQVQAQEIQKLSAERSALKETIKTLRSEIENLQTAKAAGETKITELERQIIEIRDGYQHKLDDLRGRIRGVMQGQLTRWLQTALDASRAAPPKSAVINERLEDALHLIEKELQWLQPSA